MTVGVPPTVRFEAYLGGAWVDLSDQVHHSTAEGGQMIEVVTGRQTELEDVEPTRITLTLKNDHGHFTPGNPLSPYPGWGQGVPVRLYDVIAGDDYPLGVGYLTLPEVAIDIPDVVQPAPITAIDLLGRLDQADELSSALEEHIRHVSGGTLVEHWPLTEEIGPFMSTVTGHELALDITPYGAFPDNPAVDARDLFTPAEVDGPPGDESKYPRWLQSVSADATTANGSIKLLTNEAAITVASGQTMAVSYWVRAERGVYNPGVSSFSAHLWLYGGGSSYITIYDTGGGDFRGGYGGADATTGVSHETGVWRLVTFRMTLPSGACDLWVGTRKLDTSTIGAPPASVTFTQVKVGQDLFIGSIGQVQVRVDASASAFSYADHVAQYRLGYSGLGRQTVAERIRTLATYARVPDADVDVPDDASAVLRHTALTGTRAADAMRRAAASGGDTLLVTPAGTLTVVPRGRRYQQPAAAQIPYGWLDLGLRYRPDQTINDVTVAITGGATSRRRDQASIDTIGRYAASYTLDSDVSSDGPALADWTLRTYTTARVRCPKLQINMLPRTEAERALLRGLAIGDRITIVDRPATAPADTGDLIIQGISSRISQDETWLELRTGAMLGPAAGTPPVCPVVGRSLVGATTIAY